MEFFLEHWPFFAILTALWVIGHFMETSVFTKARFRDAKSKAAKHFWWWGRESMELHPLVAGALIGLVWIDPEGRGWDWRASAAYFVFAGVSSLFGWLVITKLKELLGLKGSVRLPGESEPPER